ncbi:crotonase/enoyl-CoA hydratase family protein [Streptomyces sp. NPDC050743]|uniref:crotonase/enoyl-CoA hydratase family protein n=1 Tax=Streptomyces sp. NPDC050743 TaxID=3365634 RepID=UPI0037A958CA
MSIEEVGVQRVGSTLLITIDRPQARNAVNAAVATGLTDALDELEVDTTLRAGVLTGTKCTFSAGMDLKAALKGETPVIPGRGFGGLTEAERTKPLIAAVEGYALGGGFELALACDLIVAAADAKFGLPEVTRGLVAAGGGAIRLPKRIPYHLAMQFLLTGETVSGGRAKELGLVNRLTEPGGAVAVALELAEKLSHNAPLSLAAVKSLVRAADGVPETDVFPVQQKALESLLASADAHEGMTAFTEHRAPHWTGK